MTETELKVGDEVRNTLSGKVGTVRYTNLAEVVGEDDESYYIHRDNLILTPPATVTVAVQVLMLASGAAFVQSATEDEMQFTPDAPYWRLRDGDRAILIPRHELTYREVDGVWELVAVDGKPCRVATGDDAYTSTVRFTGHAVHVGNSGPYATSWLCDYLIHHMHKERGDA